MLDDWTGKGVKGGARFGASLIASLVVYGSVGAGVVAATAVVRHEIAEEELEISFAPPPEPPPPPPAPPPPPVAEPTPAAAPARLGRPRPVLEVPTEIPDEAPPESEAPLAPPDDPFAPESEGDPNGTADGVVGGAPGGTGVVATIAPPPAPVVPARPRGPITLPEDAERPRPVHQIEPEIPAELRSAGVPQVRIVLRVTLDEEGNVTDVSVLRGHPLMPDANVVSAVRQWRFSPARIDGEAVAAIITLPVTFRVTL